MLLAALAGLLGAPLTARGEDPPEEYAYEYEYEYEYEYTATTSDYSYDYDYGEYDYGEYADYSYEVRYMIGRGRPSPPPRD